MQFIGTIEAKSDAKGRVFLPAAFRKAAGDTDGARWVLKRDLFQPCLVLYPMAAWEMEVSDLQSRLKHWNGEHRMIFRQFVSDVEVLTLDGNGRFLIPKRYQQMAALGQEVTFLGMDDRIEIWSKERMETPFLAPEDLAEKIEQLSIDD